MINWVRNHLSKPASIKLTRFGLHCILVVRDPGSISFGWVVTHLSNVFLVWPRGGCFLGTPNWPRVPGWISWPNFFVLRFPIRTLITLFVLPYFYTAFRYLTAPSPNFILFYLAPGLLTLWFLESLNLVESINFLLKSYVYVDSCGTRHLWLGVLSSSSFCRFSNKPSPVCLSARYFPFFYLN